MSGYSIGLSALRVNQRALDLIGQNISNAATPGYHRQQLNLASRIVGNSEANGVEATEVRRFRSGLLETAVLRNTQEAQGISSRLDNLRQIQSAIDPGEGSVHDLLENVFNQFEQLAAQPSDLGQRRVLLGTLTGLTGKLNSLANDLAHQSQGIDKQASQIVDQVNALGSQIADLNGQILENDIRGIETNDLRDRRDQLITQVAGFINVRTVDQPYGQVNVVAANVPLVIGNQATELAYSIDSSNQAIVTAAGVTAPQNVTAGQLSGLLHARNEALPEYSKRLDSLAQTLTRGFDKIQATGLGLEGPLTQVTGQRAVRDETVPLDQAGLGLLSQAGTLTVSVTNFATGQRSLYQVAIDPSVDSLQNVADAISSNTGNLLQASVDPQSKVLQIAAQTGYGFDFAGRLESAPNAGNVAITSTASPKISGQYTGPTNDNLTFTIQGAAPDQDVGAAQGLTVEVTDGANNVIGSFNIGQGYEPGSPLPSVRGVSFQLPAGKVNPGDTYTVPVTADPDSADILTALGVNTLFGGDSASSLTVRSDLVSNPDQLSASLTGQVGDGANLRRLASLRDDPMMGNGTQSLSQYYAEMVSDVGIQVQGLESSQTAKDALGQRLEAQRQSISGVDPNEELLQLLQFQRAFQMSARYLTVVNTALDELFNIIG